MSAVCLFFLVHILKKKEKIRSSMNDNTNKVRFFCLHVCGQVRQTMSGTPRR